MEYQQQAERSLFFGNDEQLFRDGHIMLWLAILCCGWAYYMDGHIMLWLALLKLRDHSFLEEHRASAGRGNNPRRGTSETPAPIATALSAIEPAGIPCLSRQVSPFAPPLFLPCCLVSGHNRYPFVLDVLEI